MKSEDKFAQFLDYSALLYNYLSLHHLQELSRINTCQWLNQTKIKKSSFKCLQNYLCIGGEASATPSKGILCTYYTKIPKLEQLDDDRIVPSMTLKNQFQFASPVTHIEQFANCYPNTTFNNCLALSTKAQNDIFIMPLDKLTTDKNNSQLGNLIKLQGHTNSVTNIKWAHFKDSSYKLLTTSLDKNIIVWDLQKMCEERVLKYHKDSVNDVTALYNYEQRSWFEGPQVQSPEMIASVSSDSYTFLWDFKQKNPVNRINCRQKQLYSIACLSTNAIITGGSDGNIKFWDLKANKQYSYDKDKVEGHKGKINKLEILRPLHFDMRDAQNSHVGKIKFASSSNDGKIILWQQKNQFTHEGHYSEITDFDYLRDGNFFISSCAQSPKVMIWQEGVTLGSIEK